MVHPDVRGGYCPCPAFSQLVLFNQSHFTVRVSQSKKEAPALKVALQCKHLLAVVLADKLDGFKEKNMGLTWLHGLSAKFGTVPPVPA